MVQLEKHGAGDEAAVFFHDLPVEFLMILFRAVVAALSPLAYRLLSELHLL